MRHFTSLGYALRSLPKKPSIEAISPLTMGAIVRFPQRVPPFLTIGMNVI